MGGNREGDFFDVGEEELLEAELVGWGFRGDVVGVVDGLGGVRLDEQVGGGGEDELFGDGGGVGFVGIRGGREGVRVHEGVLRRGEYGLRVEGGVNVGGAVGAVVLDGGDVGVEVGGKDVGVLGGLVVGRNVGDVVGGFVLAEEAGREFALVFVVRVINVVLRSGGRGKVRRYIRVLFLIIMNLFLIVFVIFNVILKFNGGLELLLALSWFIHRMLLRLIKMLLWLFQIIYLLILMLRLLFLLLIINVL